MELDEYLALQRKEKKRNKHEERDDQIRFVRYVRAKYPNIPIFMSPIFKFIGSPVQRMRQGKLMKEMGYTPGTPDITIPAKRRGYGGFVLELKSKDGSESKEQTEVLDFCKENNYFTSTLKSSDEAIKLFDWYMSGTT